MIIPLLSRLAPQGYQALAPGSCVLTSMNSPGVFPQYETIYPLVDLGSAMTQGPVDGEPDKIKAVNTKSAVSQLCKLCLFSVYCNSPVQGLSHLSIQCISEPPSGLTCTNEG